MLIQATKDVNDTAELKDLKSKIASLTAQLDEQDQEYERKLRTMR